MEQKITVQDKEAARRLMDYIDQSPSAYQATDQLKQFLEGQGFQAYTLNELVDLKEGDRGFYVKNGSAIVAFVVGKNPLEHGMQIFGAHSDSPALKIKPHAMSDSEGIRRLTTEVYGGPILNTWFDRPLSLAGRVALKSDNPLAPEIRLIDFKKPLLTLPNLCIHMNRDVNDGVKIERQKVLLPFVGMAGETTDENWLKDKIAAELGCQADDILEYDLYTYETTKGCFVGEDDCFMSIGRLDNLAMAYAGMYGLAHAELGHGLKVCLVTDHEEVGSRSKQGAQSAFIRDFLESCLYGLGASAQDILGIFDKSYMISADLAHAVHPNYSEYADPTHRPRINGGPVIKYAASQSYASDAESAAIFKQICDGAGVPVQAFVNRSDLRGGSTIGPLSSALLPLSTVDIGTAIWGMHSIRETGGTKDCLYMEQLATYFFSL